MENFPARQGAHGVETAKRLFEITVFNSEVRQCLKDNCDHHKFNERWSDVQRIVIAARDESDLEAILQQRYPRLEGFVIERLTELPQQEPVPVTA